MQFEGEVQPCRDSWHATAVAAPDCKIDVVRDRPAHGLSLYHISDELQQMVSLRIDMVEAGEDTAEIDAQLKQYFGALPQKVDAVAAVLRFMDSQVQLATEEVARLNARRRSIESERERLTEYVKGVLAALPEPKGKTKTKKLEGKTATLALKPNGGQQPLDIQEELVPKEYMTATVVLPYLVWEELLNNYPGPLPDDVRPRVTVQPSNSAIRKALEENCWDCSGKGHIDDPTESGAGVGQYACPACGGTGKQGVPGCVLQPRGATLQIK